MAEYIYDDSPIERGDAVEFNHPTLAYNGQFKNGKAYLVANTNGNTITTMLDDRRSTSNGMGKKFFRKIKTLDGELHHKGNAVIYIGDGKGSAFGSATLGQVYKSHGSVQHHIHWDKPNGRSRYATEFKVICTYNNINNERLIK